MMHLRGKGEYLVLQCSYHEREFPKELKGRWNKGIKAWTFSPSVIAYKQIIELARLNEVELTVDPKIKEYFEEKIQKREELELEHLFKTAQFEHQKPMTELFVNQKKAFAFTGVGTGKTKSVIDAVDFLHKRGSVDKVLVISPASIMWNFAKEVRTHSYYESTIIYGSKQKRIQLIEDSRTLFDIINYEMLDKLQDELIKKDYDMVILDEIHYCKTRAAVRSKAAHKICKDIPYRVGLSGTIISNSYEDLFMPYKIIDESIFGDAYWRFRDRYFYMGGFQNTQVVGIKKEEELKRLVATNSIKFDIRDVVDNLPDEMNIIKDVHLEPKTKKAYKQMKDEMLIEYDHGDVVAANVLTKILRLAQITSGFTKNVDEQIHRISTEKLQVLETILEDTEEKTAIFCKFTESIDRVAELCKSLGKSYYIYDGRTKDKWIYEKFEKDDTQIFIAQLQKSEGYDLKVAQYMVFYEMDYSRKNHVQARGRLLRASGSKFDKIFYIYLIAPDTIDEVMYEALKGKDSLSEQALTYVRGV